MWCECAAGGCVAGTWLCMHLPKGQKVVFWLLPSTPVTALERVRTVCNLPSTISTFTLQRTLQTPYPDHFACYPASRLLYSHVCKSGVANLEWGRLKGGREPSPLKSATGVHANKQRTVETSGGVVYTYYFISK